MEKPNNYETTQAAGEFVPIDLGGHYLVIKQVEEGKSSSGLPMITVSFDTANNDKQPHYFADQYLADIRPNKKWPYNGISYVLTEDENKNCSRNFKGFTTSVEKSNPGYEIQWGPNFAASLKGKLVGGVFREELGVYNGKETHQRKLAWFCSNEKVETAEVPAPSESKEHRNWANSNGLSTSSPDANGFMSIPDGIGDELPFA